MRLFSFFVKPVSFPVISFGITVCNEYEELEKLLAQLLQFKQPKDQIVVLQDITEPNGEVTKVIEKYADRLVHIQAKLDGDFSSFKNNLITHANGDYLFQIDADELLADSLIHQIHDYLYENHQYDCFSIPRINIVRGITSSHLAQWSWSQNKEGYINFPDYQMRLFKINGKKKIRWTNKVHEVLVGFRRKKKLPIKDYSFCLIHDKAIKKQEKQNKFYEDNF
ncbi:glycosyltransferase [Sphingobacterium sp. MYb382]